MKILLSWIGLEKDFSSAEVNTKGPNYQMHVSSVYSYDKHIVLYNQEQYFNRARIFQQRIEQEFSGRKLELTELAMNDERDLNEVQNKVSIFLKDLENDEVTILLSTGTSIFKIAWYVFAVSLQQDIRLVQYREKQKDFSEVKLQKSSIPYFLIANEQSVIARKNPASISGFYESPIIQPLLERASKVAVVDNTVLIHGETGTGKEQVAKFIHDNSARKNGPFIPINCSSLNDNLLSAELFGHTKGAFTGAVNEKAGVFELASGGTVFLDEIGDISGFMQQSLLRVLQEKKVQRVGSTGKEIDVNVRIVAATNRDLLQKTADKSFRDDLYYRLAVNEIEMPTLRDWPQEEKISLIDFLIKKKSKDLKLNPIVLSKEVLDLLLKYPFPGNIRELENLVSGLYPFRTENPVDISVLPKRINQREVYSLKWDDVEANHIRKVLKITRGNQSKACDEIGMAMNTLKDKLKKYNISLNDYK